jgi:hypothetical protein
MRCLQPSSIWRCPTVRPVPNWPYLTLRVVDAEKGGSVNAVDMLQTRLGLWRTNGGETLRITSETVKPDTVKP